MSNNTSKVFKAIDIPDEKPYKQTYQQSIEDLSNSLIRQESILYDTGIDPEHNRHISDIQKEYDVNSDYTVVGHNYLGPGTDIISNLKNGVLPTDTADLNALYHDVDYIKNKNKIDQIKSDMKFIRNHNMDAESMASKLALTLKNIINIGPKVRDYGLDQVDLQMIDDYVSDIVTKYKS